MAMNSEYAELLIREAFLQLCDEEYRDHEEADPIPVSFSFELYMDELMVRRHGWMFRRNMKPLVILLATLAVMIFSVILAVTGLWAEENVNANGWTGSPDYAEGNRWTPGYGLEKPTDSPKQIEDWYHFTSIPEGYEYQSGEMQAQQVERTWEKSWDEGDEYAEITVRQSCGQGDSWIVASYASRQVAVVGGYPAIAHRIVIDDYSPLECKWTLEWNTERYRMRMIALSTDREEITLERMIQWAESLEPYPMENLQPDDSELEE